MPIAVSDPDDPRIEEYRAIRERDLVGRQHRFVAEGEVVLRVLLQQPRFRIESLLLAEGRLNGLSDALALLPPQVRTRVRAAGANSRACRGSSPGRLLQRRPTTSLVSTADPTASQRQP